MEAPGSVAAWTVAIDWLDLLGRWRPALSLFAGDFGGLFTKDSGAVGGFRCDASRGACANAAKQSPGSGVSGAPYGIAIEQGAGTSMLWHFVPRGADATDPDD